MDTNFDTNSQFENDCLANLRVENDRLSNSVFSLQTQLRKALDSNRELNKKLSEKKEGERTGESELVASLKARITELEAASVEKDRRIASLEEEKAALVRENGQWKSSLQEAIIRITNLQAQVNVQSGALFAPTSESIRRMLNRRDPLENAAYAYLYFGGKEKLGLTDAQSAMLDEHRKKNPLKANLLKGLKLLKESAKDSEELGTLIAERERLMRERRKRSREERKEARRDKRKERAQYAGLDLKSVNRRIKEIIKSKFPGIDPRLIKFECYSEDRPLPQGVTVLKAYGAPDYTYQYVIAFDEPTVTVYVAECVRVKALQSSKAGEEKDQKPQQEPAGEAEATQKAEDPLKAQSAPPIVFNETGFATVPCTTLPVKRALYTTPFNSNGLAFILMEKYVFCSTLDSIMARFSGMRCLFPGTTFNDYLHHTVDLMRWSMEDLFMERLRQEPNLNVDESIELVGVMEEVPPQIEGGSPENVEVGLDMAPRDNEPQAQADGVKPPEQEQTGTPKDEPILKPVIRRKYKKRYVWVFRCRKSRITFYRYDDGSRARHVLVGVLTESYQGTIISDCYVVYDGVGKKVLTDASHACCWVHVRRYFLQGLFVAPDEAAQVVDTIRDLFCIEATAKETMMTPEETVNYRALHSIPKVNDFFNLLEVYKADPTLMAYDKFAQAVNYALNHKTELLTYLKDGNIQMHNSDAERAFKIIKKWMRVSLNIGSERAAMNHAFALSLFETAREWNLNIPHYLEDLFKALNTAPRVNFDYKRPEAEQKYEIEAWKKVVRPYVEPLLPWNYGKK